MKNVRLQRKTRHQRIRNKVIGTEKRPRLSVHKSNKFIYAQIISDIESKTLTSASDHQIKGQGKSKVERAFEVGKLIAKNAMTKKISSVVFDRGGNKFHGRIKALAEGAREGGLVF
ncbi:50S ribosomal protein L18 [Candidatus Curtissbacteria bacterium]|nr:50S ribosomal protein L18 [Candidatus Curtissbacteria bacterium]